MAYCASRFRTFRRRTVEVRVGSVGIGGSHPIRLQSMTTSDTQDVAATVKEAIAIAEAGSELVRVTAPNVAAAQCLREIRTRFTAAGFGAVPLVADIHFLPQAAMEAVEHVEKIRVNPGNYADKKKFAVREYSDADYDRELQRLHEAFTPLVLRCKTLGRALRIGTNHGSLSDRIMNRYGDSPLGMVESALEFVRICESHGFHDLVLSMKASNPKIVIQTYRLLVERMDAAHRPYPLHLGVTEAGDGEDGRIKSTIGIGALLLDGLGDTIRVSLTEDSIHELPVARVIADLAMSRWHADSAPRIPETDGIDPFRYTRRTTPTVTLGTSISAGANQPPRVIVRLGSGDVAAQLAALRTPALADTPAEGVLLPVARAADLAALPDVGPAATVLELAPEIAAEDVQPHAVRLRPGTVLLRRFTANDGAQLTAFARLAQERKFTLALDLDPAAIPALATALRAAEATAFVFTLSAPPPANSAGAHPVGAYRLLAETLRAHSLYCPIWIRNTVHTAVRPLTDGLTRLLEASLLTGALLADGIGDIISVETESDPARATRLAYNILQGAGARISKTEYVACPSCGRTLFDLQTTTQRIRAQTGHLKGVKIAIMGCIVNGPGEMADADFGYVGGAPGRINLYVGKQCVQFNLPQEEADARLIALIKEHGKWVDPRPISTTG
ncbi:MAG: (E)-4-hydroxy-3-methylbut-2-enyl-diphosphate synthase [Opitutae bacterium]|nr:(E)-4-hydroxy-3-methylbut-2-enyl-diphosphate synthase [Opitutae bacterium]